MEGLRQIQIKGPAQNVSQFCEKLGRAALLSPPYTTAGPFICFTDMETEAQQASSPKGSVRGGAGL